MPTKVDTWEIITILKDLYPTATIKNRPRETTFYTNKVQLTSADTNQHTEVDISSPTRGTLLIAHINHRHPPQLQKHILHTIIQFTQQLIAAIETTEDAHK